MSLSESPFKNQVKEFLDFLGPETVFSLSGVASSNRITPTSLEEATDVVLLHTRDIARLFSYKRIKSQSLFLYLHKNGVPVSRDASKTQLVFAVQNYWAQQIQKQAKSNTNILKRRASDPSSSNHNAKEAVAANDGASHGPVVKRHLSRGGQASRSLSESSSSFNCSDNLNSVDKLFVAGSGTVPTFCHNNETKKLYSDQFSKKFCEWYYTMLNRLQPECAGLTGDVFGENVFLSNSSVDIFLIDPVNGNIERHAQDPTSNFNLIIDVCNQFRLLFSPNLENGTQALKSSYGMVKVLCCGTLFQNKSFIGIFEQEFGLVKCPVDGVWKIMYTKVNLKQTSESQEMPTLPQCEVFEIEWT